MGYISDQPQPGESVLHSLPWFWCGLDDRAGDISPWKDAPLGSIYVYIDVSGDDATLYLKISTADQGADWEPQAS